MKQRKIFLKIPDSIFISLTKYLVYKELKKIKEKSINFKQELQTTNEI